MKQRRANILILAGMLSFGILYLGLTYGLGLKIPCLFKSVTGIPCPGCGGSRSFEALLHGDFYHALVINPLSVVLILSIIVSVFWLICDLVRHTDTFTQTLQKLNNSYVLWGVLLLLMIHWARNILLGM